jgi:hypothetical protein
MFRKFQRKSSFAQVGTEYAYGQLYMYVQRSPTEIQTPTPWNLIGHNMTAPRPMLSPRSIFPPASSRYVLIPARKNSARLLKNVII